MESTAKSNRMASVAGVLVALAVAVTGCSARDDSSSSGDTGAAGPAACSPGITDTTIELGGSGPQSGAVAAWWDEEIATKDYFDDLNAAGGVKMPDGKTRTVHFTPLDDGYDPARTLSNVRQRVEQKKVFAISDVVGTANGQAIADYVRQQRVPDVLGGIGVLPDGNKWMTSTFPSYDFEATIWVNYIRAKYPNARVGILFQNDVYGQTIAHDFKAGVAGSGITVVEQSFQQGASSIDSQMVNLSHSNIDVWLDYADGTYMTQSLKKADELGWRPKLTILASGANSKALVGPAGNGVAVGALTFHWLKDVSSPDKYPDGGTQRWIDFAKRHGFDPTNSIPVQGYENAQILQQVLENMKGCTRQDFMDVMTSLQGVKTDVQMPGVVLSFSPDYRYAINSVKLLTWNGSGYDLGDVVTRGEGLGK